MTLRSLTLVAAFATLLAPAAFAGGNSDYNACMSREKANNGGIPCAAMLDETEVSEAAFAVQQDGAEAAKPVHQFDTWPGKSTR